jgi:hypothetical protein
VIQNLPLTKAYRTIQYNLIADAIKTYYSSEWGAHTKAHVKLASLMVTFACAAIAVEMSFSAGAVFKTVVATVLSAFLSSLINPSSLETALQSSCFSVCISLFALLALLKIPNPSFINVYFRPAFLGANLILFVTTIATIVGLPP